MLSYVIIPYLLQAYKLSFFKLDWNLSVCNIETIYFLGILPTILFIWRLAVGSWMPIIQ